MQRRDLLLAGAALIALARPSTARQSPAGESPAGAQPFDYAVLKGLARARAAEPYRAPPDTRPASLRHLSWDQYQSIHSRRERALWAADHRGFKASFFHLGLFYDVPVRIFEVREGQAREIPYDPRLFDLSGAGVDPASLPADLGFAGLRLNFHTDWQRDIVAFLGASYFRAVGASMQYGLSARGLAVDCGMDRPEEFPIFRAFWLERPGPSDDRLTLYALLDSPSVAGAYRFLIQPGEPLTMDVDVALYPRRTIERLGIAPLTSMYLCGSNDCRLHNDWRPQIHDSDGLSMWRGNGEWLWRPLTNPTGLRFSAFADEAPRGFGLVQRNRNFADYQDDGVFYDRRPSVWIEPRAGFGRGAIELVELPAADETADNIVAFWNPETAPVPGQEALFAYRISWGQAAPATTAAARVVATRTGIGGVVGRPREHPAWRFVIDFEGGELPMLAGDARVETVVEASRGKLELVSARPLASINGYRAMFDIADFGSDRHEIVLRAYLRLDGQALSETWLYAWSPQIA